eukprot:TRINITY_DN51954_c0_g1_i1.p3 TRINITY_DN51954_c0_g1~~TRINITY_DN51954_c0_g1_i1.p3  ORF type:complete len:175 (+),score=56.81 TRINITY_DN51954_c0_g1_i1:1-525(+)
MRARRGLCDNAALHRLGLGRNADFAAVQGAYKRLALTQHPDKGGCVQDFIELKTAFEEACRLPGVRPGITATPQKELLVRMEAVLGEIDALELSLTRLRRQARQMGTLWEEACTPCPEEEGDWEQRGQQRQDIFGPMMDIEQEVQQGEALRVELEAELAWLQAMTKQPPPPQHS